jgi:hypothetical protein
VNTGFTGLSGVTAYWRFICHAPADHLLASCFKIKLSRTVLTSCFSSGPNRKIASNCNLRSASRPLSSLSISNVSALTRRFRMNYRGCSAVSFCLFTIFLDFAAGVPVLVSIWNKTGISDRSRRHTMLAIGVRGVGRHGCRGH